MGCKMSLGKLKHRSWILAKKICAAPLKKRSLFYETYKIIRGMIEYKKLRKKVGKNAHVIFFRGATGDTYIQFLLLDSYLKEKQITNYVLAGDSTGLLPLSRIFCCSNVMTVPFLEYIEKAYLFIDGEGMNVIFPFCWADNFHINKCRIRMTEAFDFMDTYKYFSFQMNTKNIVYRQPVFRKVDENLIFSWEKQGIIKDKTVLIAPDANSVTRLPIWFWNGIIKELQGLGYTVFFNCSYFTFFRASNLFTAYDSCVPMLEYAGNFIGVRSGFCDIISSAKCNKVILYPKIQSSIDYSKHRSEIEFSGLEVMGLYKGGDLHEISTPLLRNITDKNYVLSGTDDYFSEIEQLRKQILNNFKEV